MTRTKATAIRRQASTGRMQARSAGKTTHGREVWVITGAGQRRKVVTSQSSAAAMDDAVTVYSDALKRLAKR